MAPSLRPGDRLLVLKREMRKRERAYAIGDIVIFEYGDRSYIKRIVGVPGQHVLWHGLSWELNATEYFALGDNRSKSIDSRTFGPIPHRYIFGRVVLKYFPSLQWLGRSHRSTSPHGQSPSNRLG